MSLSNLFLLLGGVALVWLFLRFGLGPRRGAPGLGSMFRRERAVRIRGLDSAAIATLVRDAEALVAGSPELDGLALTGPFADSSADPASEVVLATVMRGEAPQMEAFLARWAYPARGHRLREQASEGHALGLRLRLRLAGAPPVRWEMLAANAPFEPDAELARALRHGFTILDSGSGALKTRLAALKDQHQKRGDAP